MENRNDEYDENYGRLTGKSFKLRSYSAEELEDLRRDILFYFENTYPLRKANTSPKNYALLADAVNSFFKKKVITRRYICDIYNNVNAEQSKIIERIDALKVFLTEYIVSKKKATINRDTATVEWHVLVPFFAATPSPSNISKQIGSLKSVLKNNYYEQFELEKDISLYWFDYGVAVYHIKKEVLIKNIFEFSLQRRSLYKSILEGHHPLSETTKEILKFVHNENSNYIPITSENAYALSIVNVQEHMWDISVSETALKLFSNPSMLYNDHREMLSEKPLSDEIKNLLTQTEKDYLTNGISNFEFNCFAVKGVINGYATWAGVSLQIENTEKCLPCQDFISFEIMLQSIWFLISHYKQLIVTNREDIVQIHNLRNKIKIMMSEIFNILPREPIVMRLFKEAVIKTSRLEKLYQEFKEIMEI